MIAKVVKVRQIVVTRSSVTLWENIPFQQCNRQLFTCRHHSLGLDNITQRFTTSQPLKISPLHIRPWKHDPFSDIKLHITGAIVLSLSKLYDTQHRAMKKGELFGFQILTTQLISPRKQATVAEFGKPDCYRFVKKQINSDRRSIISYNRCTFCIYRNNVRRARTWMDRRQFLVYQIRLLLPVFTPGLSR